MERRSKRRRHSRSRSPNASRSRSRSRDRKSKYSSSHSNKRDDDRNDHYHRYSRKHRKRSRSKSPIIKSVRFDEITTKKEDIKENKKKEKKKEDFNASGALKRDLETTKNGVVLKYNEPPEGTINQHRRWRLYEYKDNEQLKLYYLHRNSFFLIGRDQRVSDIYCKHPSISSQHAVIQHRRVKASNDPNDNEMTVRPYIMDLKSRHGTYLMGNKIEPFRFYELWPKDSIKFGVSTRIYTVLAEDSNEKDLIDKSEIQLSDEENEENDKQQKVYNIWSDDED